MQADQDLALTEKIGAFAAKLSGPDGAGCFDCDSVNQLTLLSVAFSSADSATKIVEQTAALDKLQQLRQDTQYHGIIKQAISLRQLGMAIRTLEKEIKANTAELGKVGCVAEAAQLLTLARDLARPWLLKDTDALHAAIRLALGMVTGEGTLAGRELGVVGNQLIVWIDSSRDKCRTIIAEECTHYAEEQGDEVPQQFSEQFARIHERFQVLRSREIFTELQMSTYMATHIKFEEALAKLDDIAAFNTIVGGLRTIRCSYRASFDVSEAATVKLHNVAKAYADINEATKEPHQERKIGWDAAFATFKKKHDVAFPAQAQVINLRTLMVHMVCGAAERAMNGQDADKAAIDAIVQGAHSLEVLMPWMPQGAVAEDGAGAARAARDLCTIFSNRAVRDVLVSDHDGKEYEQLISTFPIKDLVPAVRSYEAGNCVSILSSMTLLQHDAFDEWAKAFHNLLIDAVLAITTGHISAVMSEQTTLAAILEGFDENSSLQKGQKIKKGQLALSDALEKAAREKREASWQTTAVD